jgi:GNAT superfamily N-acetyltransferase
MSATSAVPEVRPLAEADLAQAIAVLRLAFAAHFKLPPDTFWRDRDYVTGRWLTYPSLAFGAWIGDRLVGSSLGAHWGSMGVYGPLSTHPDTWNRGVASYLIRPVLEQLELLQARHIGFFTFAESTKHIALYQKFGFWPRFLTAIMSGTVAVNETVEQSIRYSAIADEDRKNLLDACRSLTAELREGLDLSAEIRSADKNGYGDTVSIVEGSQVKALARLIHDCRAWLLEHFWSA